MSFTSLGLAPALLKALETEGYSQPTPIQKQAIPAVIAKKDVLGIAKTGSGKTAGYVLPILHNFQTAPPSQYREPTVLVLVPTRELAGQVRQVFQTFIPSLTNRPICLAVSGGVSINPQMQAIGKVNILVATPGRLLELIEKNAVRLSSISTLVLDEADKMLNLGFREEVDRILALLPTARQNLLFSATLGEDVGLIRQLILNDPQVIKIAEEPEATDPINQLGYLVSEEKKGPLLRYLIKHGDLKQVLVFASSTLKVDGIVNKLLKNRIHAAAIHSKLGQQARNFTLQQFKSGQLRVLVATDLLARGIDIEFLPCVINYELPRSPKDYLHRIGRTGRAESPGDAISLISPEEMDHFKVIQKKMGTRVKILSGDQLDLQGY
ncbi:MAG: DEAD/DEAH box helicase [Luteolibacter sp.]|uniref:DEAD/DEAH box helicase n=1 Tax=Luteolibacter sp. TaxID=1962973 RepID=UPI003264C431